MGVTASGQLIQCLRSSVGSTQSGRAPAATALRGLGGRPLPVLIIRAVHDTKRWSPHVDDAGGSSDGRYNASLAPNPSVWPWVEQVQSGRARPVVKLRR